VNALRRLTRARRSISQPFAPLSDLPLTPSTPTTVQMSRPGVESPQHEDRHKDPVLSRHCITAPARCARCRISDTRSVKLHERTLTGLQGDTGAQGADGPQGPAGLAGPAGADGTNGATCAMASGPIRPSRVWLRIREPSCSGTSSITSATKSPMPPASSM